MHPGPIRRWLATSALVIAGALLVETTVIGAQEKPLATKAQSETPIRIAIDGAPGELNTERSALFWFDAKAGQSIEIDSDRFSTLFDPFGRPVSQRGEVSIYELTVSGTYLVRLSEALHPPARVVVRSVDTSAVAVAAGADGSVTFDTSQTRRQYARVRVRGGVRQRLAVESSYPEGDPDVRRTATVCAQDRTTPAIVQFACVSNATIADSTASATFVPTADQDLDLIALVPRTHAPTRLVVRVETRADDVVLDPARTPVVERSPEPGQSLVFPFWGTPAQRGVVSSPIASNVEPWGQPWIDRESLAGGEPVKVYATPIAFGPQRPPFVRWTAPPAPVGDTKATLTSTRPPAPSTTTIAANPATTTTTGAIGSTTVPTPNATGAPDRTNKQRFGVFTGEDRAADVPADGTPVAITNDPWFASIASTDVKEGGRYEVKVRGSAIRPLALALRDPSGKFSSNRSPWQWSDDGTAQQAVTTFGVDRGGRWALEMRASGNRSVEVRVTVTKVGDGQGYEGAIDVPEVLAVGDETDVQLGPNEFARMKVRLTSSNPQIVQPEVLRYRNTTFQPTAADLSLWDAKGRLVWSNNRNLEEEVLSGRLGKEPELTERFATVASAQDYTLVVDPHTDIAGRFRVRVGASPVVSDVPIGNGPIPRLPGGTRTGVVVVTSPTRYRITGANACVVGSSTEEWQTQVAQGSGELADRRILEGELAIAGFGPTCVHDGWSLTLPTGVHRLAFADAPKPGATFTPTNADSPAEPLVFTVPAAVGGEVDARFTPAPDASASSPIPALQFTETAVGRRLLLTSATGSTTGTWTRGVVVQPDGSHAAFEGVVLITQPGSHTLLVREPVRYLLTDAPAEVAVAPALRIGERNRAFTLLRGQRLEIPVTVTRAQVVRVAVVGDSDREGRTLGSGAFDVATDDKHLHHFAVRDDLLELAPGRYTLLFRGEGRVRISLVTQRLRQVIPVTAEDSGP